MKLCKLKHQTLRCKLARIWYKSCHT